MNRTYLRGELYYADLNQCVGSEQEGNRPVVIIQNDIGNKHRGGYNRNRMKRIEQSCQIACRATTINEKYSVIF